MQELIAGLLTVDPAKRFTIADARPSERQRTAGYQHNCKHIDGCKSPQKVILHYFDIHKPSPRVLSLEGESARVVPPTPGGRSDMPRCTSLLTNPCRPPSLVSRCSMHRKRHPSVHVTWCHVSAAESLTMHAWSKMFLAFLAGPRTLAVPVDFLEAWKKMCCRS